MLRPVREIPADCVAGHVARRGYGTPISVVSCRPTTTAEPIRDEQSVGGSGKNFSEIGKRRKGKPSTLLIVESAGFAFSFAFWASS